MRPLPKDLAKALYLATRHETEKKAAGRVKNLLAVAKRRGLEASLGDVLKALPAAMEEIDAADRIVIESASPMDEETAAAALDAAGIDAKGAEVVRKASPELVGGFRIRTRDGVIDATVRRALDDLANAVRRPPTDV